MPSAVTLIFLTAFILRFIFLVIFSPSPFFDTPILDSKYYLQTAVNIINGEYHKDIHTVMSPFYPVFLYYLIILSDEVNCYLIRLAHVFIGSFNCILLYFIALRLFPKRTALLAAFLMAAYGPFIFYDNQVLTVGMVVFFNLSSILLLLKSPGSHSRNGLVLLSGVLLGLSAATRPNILIFALAAVIFLRLESPGYRRWIFTTGLYMLGILVPILPFSMVNYFRVGEVILVSSSMGINLYVGNNPMATGVQNDAGELSNNSVTMFEDGKRVAEERMGRKLTDKEVSKYWTGRTLDYIREQPGHFLKNVIKKIYLFCSARELPNNFDLEYFKAFYPYLKWNPFSWGNLFPLAVVGFWFCLSRGAKILIPSSALGVYLVSTTMFFVTARYRMPAVPFLLIFSSAGAWGLIDLARENKKVFLKASILVLLIFFVIKIPVVRSDFSSSYFNLGIIHNHHHRYGLADREFQKAISLNKNLVPIYYKILAGRGGGT